MTKVLITGAYGFLGSYAVREFAEHGYDVVAFGRDPEKLQALTESLSAEKKAQTGLVSTWGQIEAYTGDFCDLRAITKATEGVDYVIHCGALLKGWGKREPFIKTNVEGTRNVLTACQINHVKRLVYTSSPSAYAMENNLHITEADYNTDNHLNHYIESKILAEQLLDAINTDLHENAYERQRKERFLYKGERLAEGLENYLVKCPVCGEFDTMVTADNEFYCTKCGHRGIYREDGFLEGKDLVYDNVYDWGKWAEEQTTAYIKEKPDDAVIFGDRNVKLYLVTNDHRQIDIFDGEVLGYKDRLEMNGEVFPFEKIIAMDMLYFGKTLLFTIDNKHLGITGERYHAIKYQKLYDAYMESHKK